MENFVLEHQSLFYLGIAAMLGAFLGLRREIEAEKKENQSFMGLRTMTLMATFGCLTTVFPSLPNLPLVGFGALVIFLAIAYSNGAFRLQRIGMTSEMSAMIIFWIGVLVGKDQATLAIILTLFIALTNGFKQELHSFAHTLKKNEWTGALQMLFFSAAILPFLPHNPVDPWGVVVPFNVWFLVILISGIGFIGYFFTKYLGVRGGVSLTALLGALVSSTAVTTSLAAESKKMKLNGIFAVGILIAVATMQIRVVGEIIAWGTPEMVKTLIIIPLSMAAASGFMAVYYYYFTNKKHRFWDRSEPDSDLGLRSPFELGPALKFGFIFIIILFALYFGEKYLGESGVYAAAFLSGFIDIDAIVLSSLESVKLGEMAPEVAEKAIIIGLFTNSLIKIFYVSILGSKKLVKKVAIGIMVTVITGAIVSFWVW